MQKQQWKGDIVQYPNLSHEKAIGLDIETKDPNIKELGPGVYRDDGNILGIAVSGANFADYYNIGHFDCTPETKRKNLAYLKEVLALPVPKIGIRLAYDVDWLEYDDLQVNGKLIDINVAEALIDENQKGRYDLNFQAEKYLGERKEIDEIDQFCIDHGLKGDSRNWLWKMPHSLVRRYGISDVTQPVRIFEKQQQIIDSEELQPIFDLECDVVRVLLLMRKIGVRIDTKQRDLNSLAVQNRLEEVQITLAKKYGSFNVKSAKQIVPILDKLGIEYNTTDKGNPSIDQDYLKGMRESHEILDLIYTVRKARTILDNFLMNSLVNFFGPDGKIHCSFHNILTDEYGTRSGRLSSSNPNLQQLPAIDSDDAFYGEMCRQPFIPFENCWWGKIDYSQIEYRFMAHYASGPGSDEVRAKYNNDPDMDYHQLIVDLTKLIRKNAKILNFGVGFGMGPALMAKKFGWTLDYAYDIFHIYHSKAPFVKHTVKSVEQVARRRGYIRTILGRRSRLVDRGKAYVMYSRLIQGSAADLMKKSMVECHKAGVFDVVSPHLTVHDELDVSVPKTKEGIEAFQEMNHIMTTCIKLKVPIRTSTYIGTNWADAEEFKWSTLYDRIEDAKSA